MLKLFNTPGVCGGGCGGGGGGGGVRLEIGFQPFMAISPTASWIWIRWCMQVYVGIGVGSQFGPVLLWAERSVPDSFWGAKSPTQYCHTGEQK